MLFVFNKSKIYSYLIALSTVVILFMVASTLNSAVNPSENVIETGVNIVEENNITNLMQSE